MSESNLITLALKSAEYLHRVKVLDVEAHTEHIYALDTFNPIWFSCRFRF